MADQTLTFRLVIDGKEAQAVLDITKGKFVETGEAAEQTNEQIKKVFQDSNSEQQKSNEGLQKLKNDLTKIVDLVGTLSSILLRSSPWGMGVAFITFMLKELINNLKDLKKETGQVDERTKKTIESLKKLYELHKPVTTYETPQNLSMVSPHQYKKDQENFEKWVADYINAMNKITEQEEILNVENPTSISPPPVRGLDLQPVDSTELKLKAEEELMVKCVQVYDEAEKQISNIRNKSATEREKIAKEESQAEINAISQTVDAVASSYNQIHNIIQDNARSEISTWKEKEAKKIEEEREAALKHAKTTTQKEKIKEQFDARMDKLDEAAKKKETERLAIWFAFQKALAIAQIAVQMAQAIAKGYGELGPVGGAIAMGVTIAALTAQAAAVTAQKFPEGFQKGGRLPKGKAGIFEGTTNEIVAPESDFKTYSAELTRQALIEARNYINISAGSNEDLRAIKNELTSLKQAIIDRPARAYLDDREAKKIVSRGGAMNRRSKI